MGVLAVSYLTKGHTSISLDNLYEMERKASKWFRKSNLDTILSVSRNDIYSTIMDYSSLFTLNNQEISFDKNKIDIYKQYFYNGVPQQTTNNLLSLFQDE